MKNIILIAIFLLIPSLSFSNTQTNDSNIIVYGSYKYNTVPDFMLSAFFDKHESVSGHSFSLQTSFKSGNFAYTIDLDFMNLSANNGFWRQKDKASDYFILDTTYLNLGINFEWFFNINPKFQIISSVGLGFGTFLGDMKKYKTAGEPSDPTNERYKKEDLAPPFFGHLLIAIALQYEIYKVKGKNPIYFKVNAGFKNSLFIGSSLGYQF